MIVYYVNKVLLLKMEIHLNMIVINVKLNIKKKLLLQQSHYYLIKDLYVLNMIKIQIVLNLI